MFKQTISSKGYANLLPIKTIPRCFYFYCKTVVFDAYTKQLVRNDWPFYYNTRDETAVATILQFFILV